MDTITIDKLKLFAYHGCDTIENLRGQDFFVSVIILANLDKVGITDDLQDSVDYSKICHIIKDVFCAKNYKTLEKCATVLMKSLFDYSNLIEMMTITIDKPNAPIGLDFQSVSVTLTKKKVIAYLGLGSNLGDKQYNLNSAIKHIKKYAKVMDTATYITTKPWGVIEGQPDYLNTAIKIQTTLSPIELLYAIKKIENLMGRQQTTKWASRLIDIDILLYDDQKYYSDNLIIPHPYLHIRDFVLNPLNQLAPHLIPPNQTISIQELYNQLQNSK